MVDGVSRVNSAVGTTSADSVKKSKDVAQNVMFDSKNPTPTGKGTSVESGNPYFKPLADDYFMDLKPSHRDDAIKMASGVRGRLGKLYAKVMREKPENLASIEIPPFPAVPKDCKKNDRLSTFDTLLREHENTVTTLLEDALEDTMVEQINSNTNARAVETQALVIARSNDELAAIYNLHVDMLNGLNGIANMIDTSTHRIITAVNANGEKVIRAIDKATNEIKEYVAKDGNLTRMQEFLNSVGLHDHMEYTRKHLGYKIDDQGDWTRQHVTDEHEETRAKINMAGLWLPPSATTSSAMPPYAPGAEFESFGTPIDASYPNPSVLFLNTEFEDDTSNNANPVPKSGESYGDSSTAPTQTARKEELENRRPKSQEK